MPLPHPGTGYLHCSPAHSPRLTKASNSHPRGGSLSSFPTKAPHLIHLIHLIDSVCCLSPSLCHSYLLSSSYIVFIVFFICYSLFIIITSALLTVSFSNNTVCTFARCSRLTHPDPTLLLPGSHPIATAQPFISRLPSTLRPLASASLLLYCFVQPLRWPPRRY